MPVSVKPVTLWQQDDGPDPSWRFAVLEVTGAAPGVWKVRNSGPGWYLHLSHNGTHVGMAHWNRWDTLAVLIAHESGPYTVTLKDTDGSSAVIIGNTLTEAKLAAHRGEQIPGTTATVTNADGNELTWPRREMEV